MSANDSSLVVVCFLFCRCDSKELHQPLPIYPLDSLPTTLNRELTVILNHVIPNTDDTATLRMQLIYKSRSFLVIFHIFVLV